ncbi:MAG TPA: AMP-binding protein [Rhodanobacteraceae bacterium]|nr:AMP-binding protein [Rhodanobacteraceae bacterium]
MSPPSRHRLDRLFEEQAAKTPDAVALIDETGAMTFAELDASAGRIADLIRASGSPDGAFVGVHMERSRRYVASVLGALKANAAVVPLPPSYPAERIREILAFAALDAILVDGTFDASLHPRVLQIAHAGQAPPTIRSAASDDPDRIAFVLCSSGSTGKPKMIARSHRSFFHRLEWTWDTHPYAPGEVCCQKAHMTTTHAIYELFEPLLRGVAVAIVSDAEAKALETFWETIRRHNVSRLLIVPSVLQASLDMPGFSPPAISVLVLMGEYVHPSLARRALAAFPQATRIYSIYGSTEASSTLVADLREWDASGGELPLGRPISADVHALVLDERLDEVAAGASGMLYIAGAPLFAEYFRSAALTDTAFVRRNDGERLYRTNDQVRRTREGAIEYLGRTDHTVKVRGFRVDLQEVEKAMAGAPSVGACAVVAANDSDGNAMLVGFASPESVDTAAVFRALREQLPDYMVPSRIVAVAALPSTASGKVDRRKLLEMYAAHAAATPAAADHFPTATGRRIAGIWTAVLGHSEFREGSSFFEIGGTSLKTFSVISKLQREFGLTRRQLPDDAIYRLPTIEALARHIDDVRAGRASGIASASTALVTLKAPRDADAPPVFMISSAGGTLGAYEKLVRALDTKREIIGVRDPFLWGDRDPTQGFSSWVATYRDAIRTRQPHGPYSIVAYSSAGAFGYEIARQLREAGEEIALLALIDPLAIDSANRHRFGHWAFNVRFQRKELARLLRLGRSIQRKFSRRKAAETVPSDFAFTREEFADLEARLGKDRKHILQLSALLELNTGLPIALAPEELAPLDPGRYFDALFAKMSAAIPDVDRAMMERLVVQYQLQVRSQHRYRLRRFDRTVVLFDQAGPYYGLLAQVLEPYVDGLVVHRVALGAPNERTRVLAARFSNSVRSHFLSMRDDAFVQSIAKTLEPLL